MREGSGSPDPDGGTARARAAVAMWAVGKVARSRARSSAGERSPHTREVAGSIPAAPTATTCVNARAGAAGRERGSESVVIAGRQITESAAEAPPNVENDGGARMAARDQLASSIN